MDVTPATPAIRSEPDCCETTITSPIAIVEFVKVNSALAPAAKDVTSVCIVPESVFEVTPVERFVSCVTAPPAPVA